MSIDPALAAAIQRHTLGRDTGHADTRAADDITLAIVRMIARQQYGSAVRSIRALALGAVGTRPVGR